VAILAAALDAVGLRVLSHEHRAQRLPGLLARRLDAEHLDWTERHAPGAACAFVLDNP
jgi:hypothetical protein